MLQGFFMCIFPTIILTPLHVYVCFSTWISSLSQKRIPLLWQLLAALFTLDQRGDASRVNLVQADRKFGTGNTEGNETLWRFWRRCCDWSRCEQTVISSSLEKLVSDLCTVDFREEWKSFCFVCEREEKWYKPTMMEGVWVKQASH